MLLRARCCKQSVLERKPLLEELGGAGCRGAAFAGTRSDRERSVSGASMAGAVAKRATRVHEEAPTITVSRPQPLNEDLNDCAEACGEASGLRSSLASVEPTGEGRQA